MLCVSALTRVDCARADRAARLYVRQVEAFRGAPGDLAVQLRVGSRNGRLLCAEDKYCAVMELDDVQAEQRGASPAARACCVRVWARVARLVAN